MKVFSKDFDNLVKLSAVNHWGFFQQLRGFIPLDTSFIIQGASRDLEVLPCGRMTL